jgi:hypothetical protein
MLGQFYLTMNALRATLERQLKGLFNEDEETG